MSRLPQRLTLIFDGAWGFCTWSARIVERLDRGRRVTAEPYQKSGVPASVGLTVEECEAAAWAVSPGDRRYRGAGAINASLAVATGIALPLLLYDLPGIRQLEDLAYEFIAAIRGKLPGDKPHCSQHPEECR
jgi:predicted DCC family thiol-disulfide oxidoreductase YuxK